MAVRDKIARYTGIDAVELESVDIMPVVGSGGPVVMFIAKDSEGEMYFLPISGEKFVSLVMSLNNDILLAGQPAKSKPGKAN